MTPLWFATSIDDYEIRNNVIILKENGNVVYEFPIPKDFKIIKTSQDFLGYKYCFIMSKYIPKKPKQIPEGYTNLTLTEDGLYCVTEDNNNHFQKKKFYYFDTSIITTERFENACNGKYKIKKEDIPNNFWFSTQFRYFVKDIVGVEDWISLNQVNKYLNGFDCKSRLINEYELICLEAFNGNGTPDEFTYAAFQLNDKNLYNKKVFIGAAWINVENWPKIVSSIDSQDSYLMAYGEKNINDMYCYYWSQPYYKDANIRYSNFIIPVLDEKNTVKVKK